MENGYMSINPFFFFLLLCLLAGINLNLAGQPSSQINSFQSEPVFEQAIELINRNKNDSAMVLLQPILEYLKENNSQDSPFGLQVQLTKGKALSQSKQYASAMTLLNNLRDNSKEREQWEVFLETCLELAQLYQDLHRANDAKFHLELARSTIDQYHLDEYYPSFAIRSAFWHGSFGYPDSIQFYSNQAIRTNKYSDNKRVKFSINVLKGWQNFQEDYLLALDYYKEAVSIAKDLNDFTYLSSTLHSIARIYLDRNELDQFFNYNDSTITACYKAIQAGHDRIYTLHDAYQKRGIAFRSLGQLDSTLHYTAKGLSQQIYFERQQKTDKIIEIDARYKDEKKSLLITQQELQLKQERRSRLLAAGIAVLILLFSFVLIYYYYQLRKANKKTREQAERLQSLDAAKSRFFANISHELRTPLTLLRGPIRSLQKEDKLSSNQKHLLKLADRSGQQLERLINEILDLRKLETGKLELQLEPTGIQSFFLPYLAQFESLAHHKSIDFSYIIESGENLSVQLDREKCRQIFYNLLSNAFKYTPQYGKILARISMDQGDLKLAVKDNGPGIHQEDIPELFDRFFQTNQPDRPAEGGTGIGLALCKEYAHLMGGKIDVESSLGKGALFTVSIPVTITDVIEKVDDKPVIKTKSEINSTAPKTIPANVPNSQKPHLLVVEDNPDLQEYIKLVLSENYKVTTASNGEEALKELIKENEFKLIISDLMMPVMDGYQLLERLKSSDATRHIPVIMLTARAAVQDKLKALRIGVDDYMLKPFDEEELETRIDNLLRNQSNRLQNGTQEISSSKTELIVSETDRIWLEEFETFVRKNIASDILSVPTMADQFAMSESTLLRQLKRLTGLSPRQYLQEIRLNEARQLLENGVYQSISQVASAIGYGETRSFSRIFKKRFGKLPSEI